MNARLPNTSLLALLIVAWSAAGVAADRPQAETAPPAHTTDLHSLEQQIERAAAKVLPAVVGVRAAGRAGFASGVIITSDGLVLSQYHVSHMLLSPRGEGSLKAGERSVVRLADGRECEADLLGADRTYDVSLLRIVEPGPFPHTPLDSEATVALGEWVLKAGHPFGHRPDRAAPLRLGRVVARTDDTFAADCLVVDGDSGGPYFDLDGRLVGIVRNDLLPPRVKEPLRSLARPPRSVFAATTVPFILGRLNALERGEVAVPDPAARDRLLSRLERTGVLPAEQWTQGRGTTSRWAEQLTGRRVDVLPVLDGDAQVALATAVSVDGLALTVAGALPAEPRCRLPDGREVVARVIGVEPAFDLALLKFSSDTLRPLVWADEAQPAVGTLVAAIDHDAAPLATGIISVARREPPGPFPTRIVRPDPRPAALPEIIGSAVQGRGYWVEYAGGHAASAGIQPGDVLLSIADTPIRRHDDLGTSVEDRWADEHVRVRLLRAAQPVKVSLRLHGGSRQAPLRRDDFPTMFEHDLPLRPSDRGGPVVDLKGRTVGITVSVTGYGGQAIPSDVIRGLLPELQSGRLVANWEKPAFPEREPTVPAVSEPVSITLDGLKQRLIDRRAKFERVLVEYEMISEALVEPRLLMAWNRHSLRDDREQHRVALDGDRSLGEVTRSGIVPLYLPWSEVAPDPGAPPEITAVLRQRQAEAQHAAAEGRNTLFGRFGPAQQDRSIFDGKQCLLWDAAQRKMVSAPAEAHSIPFYYLGGLGLIPPGPSGTQNPASRRYWFPDNFAAADQCRILPDVEVVDGAACVVVEFVQTERSGGREVPRTDRIAFDAALDFAPRRWEQRRDGQLWSVWTYTDFEEFAPGCWLPWEGRLTLGSPAWVAAEQRDTPSLRYNLRLLKARVGDLPEDVFEP